MRLVAMFGILLTVRSGRADPATVRLAARPMVGPFATLSELCAAHPCDRTEVEPGSWVRQRRSCLTIERAPVSGPFVEARTYALDCRIPRIRDATHTTHLLVRRSDGWWRSDPLFSSGGNDK